MMKKLLPLALLLTAFPAFGADEFPTAPYEFLLAKLAAAEGRHDEALRKLNQVITAHPNDPVLRYERAMILLDAGQAAEAEKELRAVVTRDPDFYDAHRVLGRLLIDRARADRSKLDEALAHLQSAFRLNPGDLSSGMTAAQILLNVGKMEEAEKILAVLIERSPDQRAINYQYAQVLTKLGRGNESKQYLERVILLDPTFAPAILQLIEIYQQEGEWTKAAESLQPLIDEDPVNVELRRQQAFFYLRAGLPEKARTSFKALVDADPKDTRSLFYLAEALSDLQQWDDADKIYRQLLEKTPNDPDLLSSFGLSQVGQRKYDEAATTFEAVLKLPETPDNIQALAKTQLALIQLQQGNYDRAIEMARPILTFRDKPNVQAINIALDALRRQKKYDEAIALLQPLAEKFTADAYVNGRLVEMLSRAGRAPQAKLVATTQAKFGGRNTIAAAEGLIAAKEHAAAIALLEDALKAKPKELELRFELGSVLERGGKREEAERTFLAILADHPEHAASLNYLGYMWAENGVNLERAQEMLTRAVSQEPRNGAYVDSLGWVYFRQGKLDLAEKYLTDATRLLPRDATVHEHLGDVFAKRGDFLRALALYKVALTLDPDPKDEEKLRTKIAEAERQTQTTQR